MNGSFIFDIYASSTGLELSTNTSKIKVLKNVIDNKKVLLSVCTGTNYYAKELKDIGLSRKELSSRVSCVVGDFDGNGYTDFAIWGRLYLREGDRNKTRKFKVLFFGKKGIIRLQQIENPERDHLWLYPPTNKQDKYLSPVSRYPGLMQSGEGRMSYYYVYDKGTNRLKKYRTASEGL